MHLQNPSLVVKVEAAITLAVLLKNHEIIVSFVRPDLGNVLKVFLEIMDDIDFEPLINALKNIIDVFGQEVAPYAVGLCDKLSVAFIRIINAKGDQDDEDAMSAI